MKLEITPRLAAVASISLLLREEITSDASAMQRTMQRLRVHCIGTQR